MRRWKQSLAENTTDKITCSRTLRTLRGKLHPINGTALTHANKPLSPRLWTREHKFWPAVARIDNLYGDKNPFCACPSMKDFAGMTDEICDNIAHDDLSLAPVFS